MKAILILVALLVSCGVVNEVPQDMFIADSAMSSTYTLPVIGQFYDTLLITRCSVGNAEDGSLRCVPVTTGKMLGETLGKVGTIVGQVTRAFEGMLDAMQPALKFMSDPFGKEETKKELMGDLERQNPTRYKEIQARLDRGDTVEEATRFAGSGGKTAAEKAAAEKQWLDFKQRQADGETDEDTIASVETSLK